MAALCSSETAVNFYQTILRQILEDGTLEKLFQFLQSCSLKFWKYETSYVLWHFRISVNVYSVSDSIFSLQRYVSIAC
jgi:hypothetical protein